MAAATTEASKAAPKNEEAAHIRWKGRYLFFFFLFATVSLTIISHPLATVVEEIKCEEDQQHRTAAPKKQRGSRTHVFTCTLPKSNDTVTTQMTIPHFIIIGAQKGGTSSLGKILDQHPSLVKSKTFEPHFFDLSIHKLVSQLTPQDLCKLRQSYSSHFPREALHQLLLDHGNNFSQGKNHTPILLFEKTPSYIVYSKIPDAIAKILFWKPKILVTLRNPVDRAFSQYKMARQNQQDYPSFESEVQREVAYWKRFKFSFAPDFDPNQTAHHWESLPEEQFAIPKLQRHLDQKYRLNFLYRGLYSLQLKYWLPQFPLNDKLHVVQYEKFKAHPNQILNDILEFVEAPPHEFQDELVTQDHRPLLSKRIKAVHYLNNNTRAYLVRLFRPYNEELATMLGVEWRNVWE